MIGAEKSPSQFELLARVSIYSDELETLLRRHGIQEAHEQQIRHALFEEPFIEKPQFLLRDEILTLANLEAILLPFTGDFPDFLKDCKKLFCPENDLVLPLGIQTCIKENKDIAFFVGAGLSKSLGLPLWNELADKAVDLLRELGIINYLYSQSIRNEVTDPKQRLSIFNELMKKGHSEKLDQFYRKAFDVAAGNAESKSNPYDPLCRIDKCIKVTTNIDTQFKKSLQTLYDSPRSSAALGGSEPDGTTVSSSVRKAKSCVVKAENPSVQTLQDDTIYQIHGSLDGLIDDWVLTAKNYIDTYSNPESAVPKFLTELFARYTVIFVGYGLEEFPILERLLAGKRKHYALLGSYSTGMPLFRLKGKYFASLEVVPCPYYMDGDGHGRVHKVLTSWAKQIFDIRTSSGFYSTTPVIDAALAERGGQ